MIDYIENNLDNEIDFSELSKITNINIFILERIFTFLTNMTLTEYIKKRRLSKAFEDIRNTNSKIIDIAFKYQYNSASSFNRAFKQLFNITPTECRKGIGNYKIIPREYFETDKKNYSFDYEIKKINSITLYCYHITSKNHPDLLYKIRELYKKVKNNTASEFEQSAMARYYEVTSLKESEFIEYKYRKQKYLLELDNESVKST